MGDGEIILRGILKAWWLWMPFILGGVYTWWIERGEE